MTSKGKRLGGRSYLVGKLQERCLSLRQAVRVVNVIIAEMTNALARGGEVEFPFGNPLRMLAVCGAPWSNGQPRPRKQAGVRGPPVGAAVVRLPDRPAVLQPHRQESISVRFSAQRFLSFNIRL
jgi:hypothetical protein